MKRAVPWLLLAALILCVPDRGTDIGQLLPVELVRITREEERLRVETDTGDFGLGATLEEAMANLKNAAPGVVFFDTADHLLLTKETLALGTWEPYFRPGVRVLLAERAVDPEKAAEYLRSREAGVTMRDIGKGWDIPILEVVNGRIELKKGGE